MADFNLDLPMISAGTITLTNGSAVVTATGNGSSWRAADGADTRSALGRGSWLVVPARSLVVPVLSIDSATQLTLMLNFAGTTGSGLSYFILPPGDVNYAAAVELMRTLARRFETTNPEDDINLEAGGNRHRLIANSDGTLIVRSGPSATDWASLPITGRLDNLNGIYWSTTTFGRPQTAAGVGQWLNVSLAGGVTFTLPSGGTWAFAVAYYTAASGVHSGSAAGVVAGGATGLVGSAGFVIRGHAWRVA